MSSKIECTAVNELIDLAQKKPMDRESADLFAAPKAAGPTKRPANGTPRALFAVDLPSLAAADPGARHAMNVAKAAVPRMTAPRPVAAPRAVFPIETTSEPSELRATMLREPAPAQAPVAPVALEPSVPAPRPRQPVRDELQTTYIPRPMGPDLLSLLKKLALPAGLLLMIGIGVGAAISVSRHHDDAKPFDIAAALPKPLPHVAPVAPMPKIAQRPAPVAPKLVAVRIESTPPGASATLLDRDTGNSMPLGSTPIEASLDPAKSYDVRFELDGRITATQHLELAPSDASPKLAVALAAAQPVAAPAAKASKRHRHHGRVATKKAAAKRVATTQTHR